MKLPKISRCFKIDNFTEGNEIISLNLENGIHLSLCTYRFRNMGDRTYQGHHWSRVLVSGLSSHRMGNRILYTEGKQRNHIRYYLYE